MEFKDDGTVLLKSPLVSSQGYWKVIDNEHIDLRMDGIFGGGMSGEFQVQIDDEILTLVHPQGPIIRYSRFK